MMRVVSARAGMTYVQLVLRHRGHCFLAVLLKLNVGYGGRALRDILIIDLFILSPGSAGALSHDDEVRSVGKANSYHAD
jgi:hypothetical protein